MNEMRRLMEMVDRSVEGDIVASADEFTIVEEHGMLHILDGEQTVRLSMPERVWIELMASFSGEGVLTRDIYRTDDEDEPLDSEKIWNRLHYGR